MRKEAVAAAGALVAMCGAVFAGTNYVNNSMSTYAGHDGSTPELALEKIQDAIRQSSNGDTIIVAPGVYGDDQGLGRSYASHWWGNARLLVVNKSLHIKSSHGAANTFIVGGHDPDTFSGLGDKAVRCLDFENDGTHTNVVEGFTLCDGATRDVNGVSGQGGCLHVSESGYSPIKDTTFLVDCVITNCIGACAEIAYGGTLMRCRVQDNSFVTSVTGATRFLSNGTAFINTLFFRNHVVDNTTHVPKSDSIYLSPGGRFVNCTFAHNSAKFYSHNYNDFYNCVFSDTAVGDGDGARHQNRVNDSTSVRGLIAPVFGDVRVRAGSSVVGAGNAAYAADESIIPCQTPFPVERMKDLYGNAIPTSGAICAGCAQEEVVPAAGAVAAYNTGTFFGSDTAVQRAASYLYPTNYPVSFRLHGDGATRTLYATTTLSGMSLRQSQASVHVPSWTDDSLEVIPPPSVEGVLTVLFVPAPAVKHADPYTTEAAADQDGSADHPFKTLQQAADSIGSGGGVIVAHPGPYDSGYGERTWSAEGVSVKARIYCGSKWIRLVSSDGPAVTSIIGAPDTSSEDGCGYGVTLIAAIDQTAAIQGFTLTGGYSTRGDAWGGSGRGCIYSYGTDLHVTDCIITNNVGYRYALGTARFERCFIAGNTGEKGLTLGAKMISCVVADNSVGNSNGILFDENSDFPAYLLNCSVSGDGLHGVWASQNGNSLRVNTLVDDAAGALPTVGYCSGCVFSGFDASGAAGFVAADPCYIGKASADLRVFSRSPAVTAGTEGSALADSDWWYLCTCDYSGRPWSFDAEGRVVSGAIQETVSGGVYVASGSGLAVVGGGSAGFNPYEGAAEKSLAFAFTPGSARPVNGLLVNGETNVFDDVSQSTTFAFSAASTGDTLVAPLYGSSWYVRPGGASDPDALGYNATCAFGTLCQAMTNAALRTGDTVVALPGVYDAESMPLGGDHEVQARAVVPSGVTLAARDGWTNTFIKGAACRVEDTDHSNTAAYNDHIAGMGKSSIRGVYLNDATAVVRGFTFTNCYVRGAKDDGSNLHNDLEGCGAGVAGFGRAERCRFVDCHAFRGGGAYYTTVVDCLFERNWGFYGGGATDNAYHYGCLSRENEVASSSKLADGFFYWNACENCTAMDRISGPNNGTAIMKNTLLLAPMMKSDVGNALSPDLFVHCAFASDVGGIQAGEYRATIEAGVGNVIAPSSSLQVDGDGRPVVGQNLAVDASDAELNSSNIGETDLLGGQRVYNAVQDIGALEGDWRPTYARAVKGSLLSVEAASPGVVTNASGRVALSDGTTLSGVLAGEPDPTAYAFDVHVTDGILSVVFGEDKAEFASDTRVVISSATVDSGLSFSYAGTGGAVIGRMRSNRGFVLTLR